MNFDEKTELTNVFKKTFENDKIQKKICEFRKTIYQNHEQNQNEKTEKTEKSQYFQLNRMLRQRMSNTQIK